MNPIKSLGDIRIRTYLTSESDGLRHEVQVKTAEIINLIDRMDDGGDVQQMRLKALAITAYEEAAMWAVKAITAP